MCFVGGPFRDQNLIFDSLLCKTSDGSTHQSCDSQQVHKWFRAVLRSKIQDVFLLYAFHSHL